VIIGAVLELIVFSLPSLIYWRWLIRRGATSPNARAAVGLRTAPIAEYGAAAAVCVATVAAMYAASRFVPAADLTKPNLVTSRITSVGGVLAAPVLALAEEMLFRGLIAGVLFRRLGFARGNAIQALVFLAVHCLVELPLAGAGIWPILLGQGVAGWLLGWLLHRSGSIAPSWLVHTGINLAAGLP